MTINLTKYQARNIWIASQKLNVEKAFGSGSADAVRQAVEHLGYVQIDTIHVIERCHHHILYNRIPNYKREHLFQAQTNEKSIFEYWTHALSYVPSKDYRYFIKSMKQTAKNPSSWFKSVKPEDMKKVLDLLRAQGPITIRDIKDDKLVKKDHEWASRKPSKKALQLGFYSGHFVVSERLGMVKKYDLADRHFNWIQKPKPANQEEHIEYLIDRSLRAQGVVSLDSICYLNTKLKDKVEKKLQQYLKQKKIIEVCIEELSKSTFWMRPELYDHEINKTSRLTHILSPFDPLLIQRKKLKMFFDYEHLFEAYIPKAKRKYGYFSLPVLIGNEIVALLDLKADRENNKLLIQSWHWLKRYKTRENKIQIDEALSDFERFQLEI